jgi:predicted nucleic acid-binding Zn finger protein
MTLSMFVKGKFDFKHVQIWLWVCLLKEKLTLNISKYDLQYVCERKSWLQTCTNMILNMFIKGKLDFRNVQVWLWVCLLKEKLTLNISKYDFEYVCQRKTQTCPDMTLSMFMKGKVDFRHVQIWLWLQSWKKKLTLNMSKYDFEYVCWRKSWL